MRSLTLQALTWGTVTAAVGSALWLAAGESSGGDGRNKASIGGSTLVLPQEPTSAGRPVPAAIVERAPATGTLPLPTGR
jgi:hypothetical protein